MKYIYENKLDKQEAVQACKDILKALPLWFAREDSNAEYIRDAGLMDSILVKDDDKPVAMLTYKIHYDKQLEQDVMDIHWLGSLPDYHRKGIGRQMIDILKSITNKTSVDIITVETLDPDFKDENYLKSYAFYLGIGFVDYYKFKYDESTPMVRMKIDI